MKNKELTFKQQQEAAYAFLDAFYNRADFGYDVKRWQPSDVNQTIIDMVNEMGDLIYTNTRVVVIASEAFQKMAKKLVGGGFPTKFIVELILEVITGDLGETDDIMDITRDKIAEERDTYRTNGLAWAVIVNVMASRKQNIEMAFLGWF